LAPFWSRGGAATGGAANPRLLSIRRIAIGAGIILVVVLTAAFVLREAIERIAYASLIRSATGYDVTIDGVRHDNGALVLSGVHALSRGGALGLDVARVDVVQRGERTAITLDQPRVVLLVDRWRGDERGAMLDGLQRFAPRPRAGRDRSGWYVDGGARGRPRTGGRNSTALTETSVSAAAT